MDEFGTRLRACAQELGLTDIEVARRLGISQQRFANYVSGRHRPDYDMLLRICRVLGTRPDRLLGFDENVGGQSDTEEMRLLRRICAAARSMGTPSLKRIAVMLDALADYDSQGEQ